MTKHNNTPIAAPANITGRDDDVMRKGLIYAIANIQQLPSERQEWSDMSDMCAIARTIRPDELGFLISSVQAHTGLSIDIWPDHDDDLNENQRREKQAFKRTLSIHLNVLKQRVRVKAISRKQAA